MATTIDTVELARVFSLLLQGYERVWHRCHILQAQMVHFLSELQAFCQLEAIELAWQDMSELARDRQGDLDALIAVHRSYLKNIMAKALLINPKDPKDVSLLTKVSSPVCTRI